jgi:hypothetical protein
MDTGVYQALSVASGLQFEATIEQHDIRTRFLAIMSSGVGFGGWQFQASILQQRYSDVLPVLYFLIKAIHSRRCKIL